MAYRFLSRLRHVATRMNQFNSEAIAITRGAFTYTTTGCRQLRKPQELSPGGAITRIEVQDWGIDVEDYQVNGVAVEPREGDRIVDSLGHGYLVSAIGGTDGEVYTYTTSDRDRYLVHSLRVSD
jgi:hypothetical protein